MPTELPPVLPVNTSTSSSGSSLHCQALFSYQSKSSCVELMDPSASNNNQISDVPTVDISTSLILQYCKSQVLRPYFRLLSLLGWRPLICSTRPDEESFCVKLVNSLYIFFVVCLLLAGYILQFAACFRRETLTPYHTQMTHYNSTQPKSFMSYCEGNIISLYFIPDCLHFLAYFLTLFLLNSPEVEQLETLMERVFLNSTFTQTWHIAQKKLIRRLRAFLVLGLLWLLLSMVGLMLNLASLKELSFTWLDVTSWSWSVVLVCLLFICLLWIDIVNVAIATSYSVYCQLLIFYLSIIQHAVREKTVHFIEFVKEIEEIRKYVNHLNHRQALGISVVIVFTFCQVVSTSYAFLSRPLSSLALGSGLIATILFMILWSGLIIFPMIQAARLTRSCSKIQQVGMELRCRPFGYQNAPQNELDSLLLYTQSLNLKARLVHIPIHMSGLLSFLAAIVFMLVLAGQLGFIPFGTSTVV